MKNRTPVVESHTIFVVLIYLNECEAWRREWIYFWIWFFILFISACFPLIESTNEWLWQQQHQQQQKSKWMKAHTQTIEFIVIKEQYSSYHNNHWS